MDLTGRAMPYSVEAEQSVLGGILIDHNCISAVSELIGEDDFYFEHNRAVYRVMLELFNTNKPIDLVTVSDALKGQGRLDAVGGVAYLSKRCFRCADDGKYYPVCGNRGAEITAGAGS